MNPYLLKSLWRNHRRQIWSFYCPLCRVPRRFPFRPQPGGAWHFFQIGLTAAFFTLVFWKALGWKGLASFVPLWALFELVYRWRVRALLTCSLCGFDPYLFRVNVQWARRDVEAHWRKKFAEKGIPYPESKPQSLSRKASEVAPSGASESS